MLTFDFFRSDFALQILDLGLPTSDFHTSDFRPQIPVVRRYHIDKNKKRDTSWTVQSCLFHMQMYDGSWPSLSVLSLLTT